jgi:hypothetical protein
VTELDWSECDPKVVGVDPAGLARAVELVRGRGAASQLCVIRCGRVVLDRAYGCELTSLFWLFSASKPYTAILVHGVCHGGSGTAPAGDGNHRGGPDTVQRRGDRPVREGPDPLLTGLPTGRPTRDSGHLQPDGTPQQP